MCVAACERRRPGVWVAGREVFRGFIPEYVYAQMAPEDWSRVVLSAYTSLLNGKSQSDVKSMFVDTLRKWPLFGSSYYTVKVRYRTAASSLWRRDSCPSSPMSSN